MSGTEKRLFLGIPAPPAILEPTRVLREAHAHVKGIRWVAPSNLHITAYFFGNVAQEMVPNLISLLMLALRDLQPFSLKFDRFCFAPKERLPRMIWARYEKAEAYRMLVEKVGSLYQQIRPEQQNRKSPIPHITLARLKNFRRTDEVNLAVAVQEKLFHVEELVLWESELKPGGAEYKVVTRFKFPILS